LKINDEISKNDIFSPSVIYFAGREQSCPSDLLKPAQDIIS